MSEIRINKRMADLGLASRREADALIAAKKVLVNGKPATLGQKVTATDTVTLKGAPQTKTYLAYYKGRGVVTHSPDAGDTDIASKIKTDYGLTGLNPIGRLDKDSEGLILLTDDGRLTGPLTDPNAKREKEYDVTVDKPINNWFQKHMGQGVAIEGYKTKPATITANLKNQKRFTIVLTEGKKHQIRRMCAALGYQVQSLKRTRIVNVELGQLKPNQYRKLTKDELSTLRKTISITL